MLLCLLSTACGFHLRSYGVKALPLEAVALDCPKVKDWTLCHHLKQTLLLNSVEIDDNAKVLLKVSTIKQTSRVLSLQPNASAAEKGLTSSIIYQLITQQDDQIRHKQQVSINNSYRHEASALLAKDRERDELQMRLSHQLAEEIVRQIRVLDTTDWYDNVISDNVISDSVITDHAATDQTGK